MTKEEIDRSVKEGGDKKQIIVLQLKEERCLAIVKNEQDHLDWLEQEIESVRGHIVRKKEKIKVFKAMKKQSKEPLDLKCRLDADYHIVKSTLRKGDLRRNLQELKKQREKSKKRVWKTPRVLMLKKVMVMRMVMKFFCYLRRLSSELMVQCLYIISACPLYLCVRLSV